MEDPWGSPWTADSTPKIDLPTPPPSAHFSLENHNQQRPAAERLPWGDGDPWGGWNDAAADRVSLGWRKSPALEPVASVSSSRQVSPGPWKLTHFDNISRQELQDGKLGVDVEGTADSGISLDAPPQRTKSASPKPTITDLPKLAEDVQDDDSRGEETPTQARSPKLALEREKSVSTPPAQPEQAPDHNARPEAAAAARQTSKVQELVEMYDGIAKRNASPAPSKLATPPRAKKMEGLSDAATEELLGIYNLENPAQSPTVGMVEMGIGSGLDQQEEHEDAKESDDTEGTPSSIVEDDEHPPQVQPPITFDIDMSKLEDLFPSVELPRIEPEPVPDVIIDDTFASISERKAWYRISRWGSIRKHNHGDDENYSTISWRNSVVRDQAIRIVRRWMEEDSIGGRVVPGRRGGHGGGNIFNWDSKAPAVGIGELLARKGKHSRHASAASKTSGEFKRAQSSPSAGAFGWASSPHASLTDDKMPPSAVAQKHTSLPPPVAKRASLEKEVEVEKNTRPQSLVPAANKPQTIHIAPPPKAETHGDNRPQVEDEDGSEEDDDTGDEEEEEEQEGDDDDDDEWGEMVSSPIKDDLDTHFLEDDEHETEPVLKAESQVVTSPGKGSEPLLNEASAATAPDRVHSTSVDVRAEVDSTPETAHRGASDTTAVPKELRFQEEPELIPPASGDASTKDSPTAAETETDNESDDDDVEETVAEILQHIPDLSYMLR